MDKSKDSLALYRLEQAEECIKSARLNLDNKFYISSANRSYYAIFYSARAVLALDGVDRKKHSAVIAYFQEHYIKTKVFDKNFSKIIQYAFFVRQNADYEDFYILSIDDAKKQISDAELFYSAMKEYVNNRIKKHEL